MYRDFFIVIVFFITTVLLPATETFAQNTTNQSFSKAKKLAAKVYAGHQTTFYCGCAYTGKKVDLASCGYKVKKSAKRAKRLEWEHVVPAHAFGQSFKEWRDGHPECVDKKGKPFKGRNCARKMAIPFRFMEADRDRLSKYSSNPLSKLQRHAATPLGRAQSLGIMLRQGRSRALPCQANQRRTLLLRHPEQAMQIWL
jgi:deoxyribonuclease-1